MLVCAYACMCCSYVWMRVFMRLSQATNVLCLGLAEMNSSVYCDGKLTKIQKRDFNFRTCEDGAGWHLIPYRISPRSEFFLRHIRTGILCEGLI